MAIMKTTIKSLLLSSIVPAALLISPAISAAQVSITGTARNITSSAWDQLDPSIDGDHVVYNDYRAGNADIYYTDLVTGAESLVTDAPGDQTLQDVSGGTIVYNDLSPTFGNYLIETYSIATGASAPIVTGHQADYNPSVSGNYVVFEGRTASSIGIYAYDMSAGATMLVYGGPGYGLSPRVYGSEVIYSRLELDGSYSVVLQDLLSGSSSVLAAGLSFDARPDLSASYAVWYEALPGGDQDVIALDRATGSQTVYGGPGDQNRPRVDGDILAYDDYQLADLDVVVVHLPSGTSHRIGGVGTLEYLNDISGDRVAYTSDAAGGYDIWVYDMVVTLPATLPSDACVDPLGQVPSATYVLSGASSAGATAQIVGIGLAHVAVSADGCAGASLSAGNVQLLGPGDFGPGAAGACWSFTMDLASLTQLSMVPGSTSCQGAGGHDGDDDHADRDHDGDQHEDHGDDERAESGRHDGDDDHADRGHDGDHHDGDHGEGHAEGDHHEGQDGDRDHHEGHDDDQGISCAPTQCTLNLDVYLPSNSAAPALTQGGGSAAGSSLPNGASCDSGPGAAGWLAFLLAGLSLLISRRPRAVALARARTRSRS